MSKIRLKDRNKLPVLYGLFIILALIPQIFGFNGNTIDTLWKAVILFAFFMILILQLKSEKITVTKYFILYVCLYILNTLITIMLNPSEGIMSILNIVMFVMLFFMFFEIPKNIKVISVDNILCFYKIFVYFIFVSCVYNMIKNVNILVHITSNTLYTSQTVNSFFDNKNTFGVFLLFGCLAVTFLNYFSKQKKWYLFMVVFIINELMAMCRTAIILSIIMLLLSTLVVDSVQKLFKRVVVIIIVIVSVLFFINNNLEIRNFILTNVFGSTVSIDARNSYVNHMIGLLQGVHLFFGYGLINSSTLAAQYTGNHYFHNTYLKVAISGGLFYEILFLTIIIYSLKTSIRVFKRNKNISYLCLLSICVYVIYAFVESVILFDTPVVAMVATVFVVSMPILFSKVNIAD